jgi:uncharacterized protein GlcG (DUF336 family)
MSNVSLAEADTIIGAALAKARESAFEPLTVVVLDAGGHLVAAKREDGSSILRYEIAFGKAYGALGFGFGSRTLAGRAAKCRCSSPQSPPLPRDASCRCRAAC